MHIPIHIKIVYLGPEALIVKVRSKDDAHWPCGKVNCDCDEQTEALMEEEAK